MIPVKRPTNSGSFIPRDSSTKNNFFSIISTKFPENSFLSSWISFFFVIFALSPHILSLGWLEESLRLQRPAPEEHFVDEKAPSPEVKPAEPPSPLSKKVKNQNSVETFEMFSSLSCQIVVDHQGLVISELADAPETKKATGAAIWHRPWNGQGKCWRRPRRRRSQPRAAISSKIGWKYW